MCVHVINCQDSENMKRDEACVPCVCVFVPETVFVLSNG